MGVMKEYPKMQIKKEEFLELQEQFHRLALFKVCSLTVSAGGTQQVIPPGMYLLMVDIKM